MPAVDARPTNPHYPTPETFGDYTVYDLLTAAGYGRIGVDKRLVKSIIDRSEVALPDITRFADKPIAEENSANLTRSLFLLLRHYRTPAALPFLLSLVRANIEELPEELMEAVIEIGEPAVEPVLELYDGIDEDELLGEIAFQLASFRNRDPRILKRLLDYFEYDVADGAIILESFGDPAAIPAMEKIIQEPGLNAELKAELQGAVERMRDDKAEATAPSFDLLEEFPDAAEPIYGMLTELELLKILDSPMLEYRTGAVENLTFHDMSAKVTARVELLARTDPSGNLRGRAWEALARDSEDKPLIAELTKVLEDTSRPVEERSGALVALASVNKYPKLKEAILDFYHSVPEQRARVIKAMWRSLDRTWAKYVIEALDHASDEVREQAILGVGNLTLSSEVNKLEVLFEHDTLRPAALYAYALAAPGETTRSRMKSIFNRIEKLADGLDEEEAELIEAALDERLASKGLKPVFHVDEQEHGRDEPAPAAAKNASSAESAPKAGRNDPCPCGSGKKFKKCHGQ